MQGAALTQHEGRVLVRKRRLGPEIGARLQRVALHVPQLWVTMHWRRNCCIYYLSRRRSACRLAKCCKMLIGANRLTDILESFCSANGFPVKVIISRNGLMSYWLFVTGTVILPTSLAVAFGRWGGQRRLGPASLLVTTSSS